MSQSPSITPEDAVQIAQRAMQTANEAQSEVAELRSELEEAMNRIEQLEAAVGDRSEYSDLDRDTKVGMIKEHLVRVAQTGNGKAKVDYDDVKHAVFDGEPSPYHCYELMQQAAQEDGYEYREPATENKHLRLDLAQTKTETDFLRENKD